MASTLKLCSGYTMPTIGLGTAKAAPGTIAKAVEVALKIGYRHIDCAYLYRNENDVGKGLRSAIDQGIVTREDVFITSKLWVTCFRKDLVRACLQASLKTLGLDYVDLYLLHWPCAMKQVTLENIANSVLDSEQTTVIPKDEDGNVIYSDVHYLEAWKVLEECVNEGLVRSIGLSNFNSVQIQDVMDNATIKPAVNQIESHPYLTQIPLINFCRERDIAVVAFCPLGGPVGNSGPFNAPIPRIHEDADMLALGKKYGKTPAQIALRFNYQRNVAVIPRSCNEGRLKQNFDITDFELSDEDMQTILNKDCGARTAPGPIVKDHPQYPFNIPF